MIHYMRFFIVGVAFAGMLGGVSVRAAPAARPGIEVAFSPGNAEALVIRAIGTARRSIDVAARARGVDVRIVADRSQRTGRYTSVLYLASQGIPVRIDDRYAIMHNKCKVIDDATVRTGGFNYTRSAQLRNAEDAWVIAGNCSCDCPVAASGCW